MLKIAKELLQQISPDLENLVDEIFNQPTFTDEDIKDYSKEEIFITPEIIEESVLKKPYSDFIPTISFHFEKSLKNIDYDKLQDLLGKESVIINIERFPTTLQVVLLSIKDFDPTVQYKLEEYIIKLKEKFYSPIGQSIIGSLVDEPGIHIPHEEDIKKIICDPSLKYHQNAIELDKKKINKIQQIVLQKLRKVKNLYNWKFLFLYEDIYNQMEEKIREDLKANPYEMVIKDQQIFLNKFMNEYERIKKQIPKEDVFESFYYHGSRLNNHQKTLKIKDVGFYGKGIYATDNPFYAALYGNGNKILGINEVTNIICCRVIFNKNKIKSIRDNSYFGKQIDDDIKNNFGCNHALIGNSSEFLPLNKIEKEKNLLKANEFVFPNKFQIIPLCSFTLMRKDHYILWKDENINNEQNIKFLNEISKDIDVNIYPKDNVDEALNLIQTKKFTPFKLITNGGGQNLTGKQLIEKARLLTHSNFVCLVFAASPSHLEWVTKMENVLFTLDANDAKKFAQLKMNLNDVQTFALQLNNKYEAYKYKFKINKNELLKFSENENQQECNLA